MRYRSVFAIFVVICLMLCSLGPAIGDIEINIFLLNTEFFFDNKEPHGGVVGKSVPVPTAEQYEAKAKALAELIDTHKANIVGLVEVENRAVLEKVKSYLATPDDWQIAFDEGRDRSTGQDVALLTKFRITRGSATNFPDEREIYFVDDQEHDVNPSKILGVELKIDNQPFYVLIAHLISRRNQNDAKRLAQATVVRRQAVKAMMGGKNVIVMGDMNDTPGTPVINRLRGFDDIWGDFLQTANAVEMDNRYTYIHEGQKNLIDHILISPSLRNEFRNVEEDKRCEIIDVNGLSDHRAILARLRIVHPVVVLETDKGIIEMELYPDVAPKTVANFIKLIKMDFYNGLTFHRYTDLLSEASGGTVTETEIATHGAIKGDSVGDSVWTSYRLPPTGEDNIADMLKHSIDGGVIYGAVSLYSPRKQETRMYVGSSNFIKVWFNGALVHKEFSWRGGPEDYTDFFPVTLKQGRNVLLVALITHANGFFGFEPGTEYTVLTPGIDYTFSQTPIHIGDTFSLDISAETVFDLAGWQFDIAFDPAILEAINVSEGDFLKMGGSTAFFQGGKIDNAAGKITGLNAARLSAQGATGTGSLLQVNFKAKSGGEAKLTLQNFQFGTANGEGIPAGPREVHITVEGRLAAGDVNRDGVVSIFDLILVSQQLGKRVSANSSVDVNGDGIVSILDLILVSQEIAGSPAAPSVGTDSVDAAIIESWIVQARLEDDGSLAFKQGIANLENLLVSLIPKETVLLGNYPNPFNPETWISYQLATAADVALTIYDMNGGLVRRLAVGYQPAGIYRSRSRAVYWDGRNQLGESVASGLYFYTLTVRSPDSIPDKIGTGGTGETRADDFTATRRMLILK